MNPPPIPSSSTNPASSNSSPCILPVTLAVISLASLGDFLFWKQVPGISLAIYFAQ